MEYTTTEYLSQSMSSINHADLLLKVYIPAAILIAGSTLLGAIYVPFAVAIATGLGVWTVYTSKPRGKPVLDPKEFREFPLIKRDDISHNTAIYRFGFPHPHDILGLPIGQHISLSATIDGKDVMRSYTPISSDEENQGYVDLIVKAYPTGNISKYLHQMKIGDKMKIRGPKGAMVYTPNMVRHFGMIAGGTGITPMLQIIRAIIRHRPRNGGNDKTQVDLIFANVNVEDILLKDDLDRLAKEDDGFRVHYVLNNPPEGWTGGVGFVTADMIKEKCPAPARDVKMLICGPPPMVKAMQAATESLGFDKAGKNVSKLPDQVFCF